MANALLAGAARTAPIVAGAIAVPAAATLMLTATGCLCALMIVRKFTSSEVNVAVKRSEGFGVNIRQER